MINNNTGFGSEGELQIHFFKRRLVKIMQKKIKKNPIYELQKKLVNEGVILGILDDDMNVETDDKVAYTVVHRIYDEGKSSYKMPKLKIIFITIACSIVGSLILFMLVLLPMFTGK